ncbi:hypothetical protein P3T35_001049 [Kitasatospora sp. GP30]|nr:hypothetical protein [Kitasatospora sp. GP30]
MDPARYGEPVSTSTPPGWYPDPRAAGHERYWDGRDWTGQSRPPTVPAAGPVPDATPAYGQPAIPEPLVLPGPVSDASPAYGHPAIPESLVLSEPPEPGGYAGPPPVPEPGGHPLDPPPQKRTGLVIGLTAGALLLVTLVGGLAMMLSAGGAARSSDVAGAPAPAPGAARPTDQPDGVRPLTPAPPLPTSGGLQDQQHGWNVPLPEGWQVADPDDSHTLMMVTSHYECGTPGGCVRGNFAIDAKPSRGSDAETVARLTMASYAQQTYGTPVDHQELTCAPITVAGQTGFAVRWRVVPQQGTPAYLLLVAVPAADGDFTTMVGSVDDSSKSPDRAILDRIAAGITAVVPANAS